MSLTEEQINQIKKVNTIEELESKVKEKGFDLDQEVIKTLFNTYCVNNSSLSDIELNAVTGGCGDDEEEEKEQVTIEYDAFCTKCSSRIGGFGSYTEKNLAVKKVNECNENGCPYCNYKHSTILVYTTNNWMIFAETY